MQALRTPTARFDQLSDYPFSPNYCDVGDGLQMHYVDEGPKEAAPILLLHGEPSWSYLYRKMIPILNTGQYRVIAPDLIGFGKSDKPLEKTAYTYQSHLNWLSHLISQLDLQGINLFCQDWGGLLGLRILTEQPERFARVVVANTFLPTGARKASDAFLQWQHFSQTAPEFPVGNVLDMATISTLTPEVKAAYDAPFPDESYKAGARQFPILVPIEESDPEAIKNRAAWKKLENWDKPMLTLFSDSDPITRGGDQVFQKLVPGAKGQAHQVIEQAGHFLQEDKGEEIARLVLAFIEQ
ncbi:MAG: haloalkane dehalogenase [Bacteroidota bacterium]